MRKLTLKDVYDALTLKIKKAYPEKNIYGGFVNQNLKDGMFNIIPISITDTQEIDKRIKRKITFDCLYYCDDYEELLKIADELPLDIALIETADGQFLNGYFSNPTTEISDGVLHCIVRYDYFGIIAPADYADDKSKTELMYFLKQICLKGE